MGLLQEKKRLFSITLAWKMLLWLLVAQIMAAFVGRSLAPLTILIGGDLTLSNAQMGMLPAALFLGQSLSAIPSGILVDKIGSKRQLLGTVICLSIAFGMIALSGHFYLLLISIVIGGAAYGAMHPTTNRGILYWFPQRKRGLAMGIKQMGITVGAALAALILLPLANNIGWRPVLFISCLVLVLVGILASYYYKDPEVIEDRKPLIKKQSIFGQIKTIIKNKSLILISISAMGLQGAQLCLTTYIVLFAFHTLELSLVTAGLLLVVAEIGGSIGRVAWGAISDTFFKGERMSIMYIITIMTALSAFLFTMLTIETSLLLIITIVFLFGFCISGYNGIWMNIVTELVPRESSGLATGITITISSWGVVFIPPLFGYIVDESGSYTNGWFFLIALMAAVIILLKGVGKHSQKPLEA